MSTEGTHFTRHEELLVTQQSPARHEDRERTKDRTRHEDTDTTRREERRGESARKSNNWMVAIDESSNAYYAFNFACANINRDTDHLFLVCVGKDSMSMLGEEHAVAKSQGKRSRKVLAFYKKEAEKLGICCTLILGHYRHIGEVLCIIADRIKANHLVLGRRSMNDIKRLLVGSTSRYVVENANCNVAVVRQPIGLGERDLITNDRLAQLFNQIHVKSSGVSTLVDDESLQCETGRPGEHGRLGKKLEKQRKEHERRGEFERGEHERRGEFEQRGERDVHGKREQRGGEDITYLYIFQDITKTDRQVQRKNLIIVERAIEKRGGERLETRGGEHRHREAERTGDLHRGEHKLREGERGGEHLRDDQRSGDYKLREGEYKLRDDQRSGDYKFREGEHRQHVEGERREYGYGGEEGRKEEYRFREEGGHKHGEERRGEHRLGGEEGRREEYRFGEEGRRGEYRFGEEGGQKHGEERRGEHRLGGEEGRREEYQLGEEEGGHKHGEERRGEYGLGEKEGHRHREERRGEYGLGEKEGHKHGEERRGEHLLVEKEKREEYEHGQGEKEKKEKKEKKHKHQQFGEEKTREKGETGGFKIVREIIEKDVDPRLNAKHAEEGTDPSEPEGYTKPLVE